MAYRCRAPQRLQWHERDAAADAAVVRRQYRTVSGHRPLLLRPGAVGAELSWSPYSREFKIRLPAGADPGESRARGDAWLRRAQVSAGGVLDRPGARPS